MDVKSVDVAITRSTGRQQSQRGMGKKNEVDQVEAEIEIDNDNKEGDARSEETKVELEANDESITVDDVKDHQEQTHGDDNQSQGSDLNEVGKEDNESKLSMSPSDDHGASNDADSIATTHDFSELEEKLKEILQRVDSIEDKDSDAGTKSQASSASDTDYKDDKVVYATLEKLGLKGDDEAAVSTKQDVSIGQQSNVSCKTKSVKDNEVDTETIITATNDEDVRTEEDLAEDDNVTVDTTVSGSSSSTGSSSTKEERPTNELYQLLADKFRQQEAKSAPNDSSAGTQIQGPQRHGAFKLPASADTEHIGKRMLQSRDQYRQGKKAGRGVRRNLGKLDYAKFAKDGTKVYKK